MISNEPEVRLAPAPDLRRVAQIYASAGRVHLAGFLTQDCAERAYRCLAQEVPWQLHFNDGDRAYDVAADQIAQLAESNRILLEETIRSNAARRFQYLFDNFPLSDARAAGRQPDLYVMRVLDFLNSPPFLDFARQVTGDSRIRLADAQATRYRAGHFLTRHDDLVSGKDRIAAYVLNLTPGWRADWGGILNFLDRDGHVTEGYTPAFNALNLFRVPQPHAVSYVAPFCEGARYSISGWLRAS